MPTASSRGSMPEISLTTSTQIDEKTFGDTHRAEPTPDSPNTDRVKTHCPEGEYQERKMMVQSTQRPSSALRIGLRSIPQIFTAGRIGAMMGLLAFLVAVVALIVAWYTYNVTVYTSCVTAKDVR